MRYVPRILALSLLLMTTAVLCTAQGQAADHHVTGEPAQRLFRLSPFAHGYIHGYESGFGMGDEDVQMGRGGQHIEKTREFRSADRGYARAFGDRESFRAGYREGLTVGYHEALSGGVFRALTALRRLATGLENGLVNSGADAPYDGGFLSGYRAARQDHPDDCAAPAKATNPARERFCSGFLDGYELGEADSGAIATAQGSPGANAANRRPPQR